jgi:hypothetical protein
MSGPHPSPQRSPRPLTLYAAGGARSWAWHARAAAAPEDGGGVAMNILKALMEPVAPPPDAAPADPAPLAAPRLAPHGCRAGGARDSCGASSSSGASSASLADAAALLGAQWSPRGGGGLYAGGGAGFPPLTSACLSVPDPLRPSAAVVGTLLPSSLSCPLPQQAAYGGGAGGAAFAAGQTSCGFAPPTAQAPRAADPWAAAAAAGQFAAPPAGGAYALPAAPAQPDAQLLLLPVSIQLAAAPAPPQVLQLGAGQCVLMRGGGGSGGGSGSGSGSGSAGGFDSQAWQPAGAPQLHGGLFATSSLQHVP